MKMGTGKKPDIAPLRRRAEDRLKEKKTPGPTLDEPDLKKLVHELQVHQIELEMQNEELNRAREEVEEVLAKYTDLYDFAPVGYLTLDEKGLILELNLTAAQLLGIERTFLVNKPFSSFIQRDLQDRFYLHLQAVLKSPAKQTCELVLKKKDGTSLDIQLESIVMKAAGRTAARAVLTDITEHKRAEDKVKASEIRYRRLFESAKTGILILDADTGTVVEVNPYLVERLGFSYEQFLGKKIWELGLFKDIVPNQNNFGELQQKQYVRYEDLPLETADGRRVDVEFVSNVYEVDHQKVIQCNIRDITDRKLAEEEREKLILKLREALSQVKLLSGLLPICASCKKIRNDKGYWEQIELYIRDRSEADFSHSICPECAERLYPEYFKKK